MVAANLPPAYSGAGLQAVTLAREFRRQGKEVVFITRAREGAPSHDSLDGFEVFRVRYGDKPNPHLSEFCRQIAQLARLFFKLRNRYEVVMFFGPDGGLPHAWTLLPLMHACGKRTFTRMMLLNASDPIGLKRRRFGWIRLMPYRLHHGVISLSTALSKSYRSVFGSEDRLVCIPNGVDITRFRPLDAETRDALRLELGLDPRLLYCATVGRLSIRKGIDTLIDAWCHVVRLRPDARLVLIGPERDEHRNVEDRKCLKDIKEKVSAHGIGDTIVWTGRTDSVERYLQCADVFAFTSRREGCPNALLEAMACGLPIVTTEIQDITTDLVTDGQDALMVQQDADAVASALLSLIDNAALRCRLGAAARRRAESEFAIEITARRYLRTLEQA
jgi:glycosyltransferase involved in cell wall biosynthesis